MLAMDASNSSAVVTGREIFHGRFVFAALLTMWLGSCDGSKLAIILIEVVDRCQAASDSE